MNPILEKIKKLLRMKRGGTPDEVATALRLAQELAEKHGIDLDMVNPDDESTRVERPLSHTEQILGARIQWECKYAALISNTFFNVSVFTGWQSVPNHFFGRKWKQKLTFVGTEWDTQIALYVYGFLVGHFRREWKTKRGRLRNRRAFMWGMYIGISSKLRERQPKAEQKPGLVAVERQLQRRNDYIAKHFGNLSSDSVKPDEDASAARYAGWIAGRNTEIRSGVNGTASAGGLSAPASQPSLLLTA